MDHRCTLPRRVYAAAVGESTADAGPTAADST